MAKSNRPYWQTEPCPPWCFHSDRTHADDDRPEDRIHFSRWSGEVILTLLPAEVTRNRGQDPFVEPAEMRVSLLLKHRETEPRVVLATEGMPEAKDIDADLTLDEARTLVRYLTKALRLAGVEA